MENLIEDILNKKYDIIIFFTKTMLSVLYRYLYSLNFNRLYWKLKYSGVQIFSIEEINEQLISPINIVDDTSDIYQTNTEENNYNVKLLFDGNKCAKINTLYMKLFDGEYINDTEYFKIKEKRDSQLLLLLSGLIGAEKIEIHTELQNLKGDYLNFGVHASTKLNIGLNYENNTEKSYINSSIVNYLNNGAPIYMLSEDFSIVKKNINNQIKQIGGFRNADKYFNTNISLSAFVFNRIKNKVLNCQYILDESSMLQISLNIRALLIQYGFNFGYSNTNNVCNKITYKISFYNDEEINKFFTTRNSKGSEQYYGNDFYLYRQTYLKCINKLKINRLKHKYSNMLLMYGNQINDDKDANNKILNIPTKQKTNTNKITTNEDNNNNNNFMKYFSFLWFFLKNNKKSKEITVSQNSEINKEVPILDNDDHDNLTLDQPEHIALYNTITRKLNSSDGILSELAGYININNHHIENIFKSTNFNDYLNFSYPLLDNTNEEKIKKNYDDIPLIDVDGKIYAEADIVNIIAEYVYKYAKNNYMNITKLESHIRNENSFLDTCIHFYSIVDIDMWLQKMGLEKKSEYVYNYAKNNYMHITILESYMKEQIDDYLKFCLNHTSDYEIDQWLQKRGLEKKAEYVYNYAKNNYMHITNLDSYMKKQRVEYLKFCSNHTLGEEIDEWLQNLGLEKKAENTFMVESIHI